MDFTSLDCYLARCAGERMAPAIAACVMHRGKIVFEGAYGVLGAENGPPCTLDTRFDMASVTKNFCTAAFMTLVEAGVFSLDERVSESFPQMRGMRPVGRYEFPLEPSGYRSSWEERAEADAGAITWRQVLLHNAGLAWMALYKRANRGEIERDLFALPFAYPTGAKVVYTDIGLIMLGWAMEKRTGKRLDALLRERVCAPLGLASTSYLPVDDATLERGNIAQTEFCAWRGFRPQGVVHDENAFCLNGIAGHAGVFSTARDTALFAQSFLDALEGKKSLLRRETVREMVREGAACEGDRRGLGFQLRLDDPAAHSRPLAREAFGHTGFTGTCFWVDPTRSLSIALLTNEVYNGRENRTILPLRAGAIKRILGGLGEEA